MRKFATAVVLSVSIALSGCTAFSQLVSSVNDLTKVACGFVASAQTITSVTDFLGVSDKVAVAAFICDGVKKVTGAMVALSTPIGPIGAGGESGDLSASGPITTHGEGPIVAYAFQYKGVEIRGNFEK